MARRARLWRRAGGGVLLLLLSGGLVVAFWPHSVPVDVAVVERGPLVVAVEDEGRTRVKDVYVVAAPVSGQLLRIGADAGDPVVAAETILATIRPTEPQFLDIRARAQAERTVDRAEAALALAEADLARARAELQLAKTEADRATRLAERGVVAESVLDRAVAELRTAQARVVSQEAAIGVQRSELEVARAALIEPGGAADNAETCCVQVRSPHDGVVLRVLRESEGPVPAGEPLVEVGDLQDLEVVVDLLSSDAVKVRPGQEVIIEDWGGGADLTGRVRQVEPFGFTEVSALGIEEQRVNVIIEFVGSREARTALGHGYRVMTRIIVWRTDDAVSVPLGSIFRVANAEAEADEGEGWAVFILEEGRARLRPVTVGRFTDRAVQVTDGLATGDVVVLHPSDRIEDGARVARRELE